MSTQSDRDAAEAYALKRWGDKSQYNDVRVREADCFLAGIQHERTQAKESLRELCDLLQSLNIQAIVNGQIGQTLVSERIAAALAKHRARMGEG